MKNKLVGSKGYENIKHATNIEHIIMFLPMGFETLFSPIIDLVYFVITR